MSTLREWFDGFTEKTGEEVESIVLAQDSCEEWGIEWPDTVIPFSEVPAAVLDREFHAGYGGNESPDLCAWSASWVLFSDNYDGSEELQWVPRHPKDHSPIRPGGG